MLVAAASRTGNNNDRINERHGGMRSSELKRLLREAQAQERQAKAGSNRVEKTEGISSVSKAARKSLSEAE